MTPSFVRGTVVTLSASFTDKTGAAVSPAAVAAEISYWSQATGATIEPVVMSSDGTGSFSGTWDTHKVSSSGCAVSWHVETNDPSVECVAVDGAFNVTANSANIS